MISYEVQRGQTAQPLLFLMTAAADHLTGLTGLAPTVGISQNGAPFAPPVGAVSEVGFGWYQLAPTAADTGVLGPLLLHAAAPAADPTDTIFPVVSYNPIAFVVPAVLTAAGLDAVQVVTGATSGRITDQNGNPLTVINMRQALAVFMAQVIGDRSGIGTREIVAQVPGSPASLQADRVSSAVIQSTVVVPS